MRSIDVTAGQTATADQYNILRDDAYASSFLLAHQQSSPDLTLEVETGVMYNDEVLIEYAGGNSPSFTAPASNPRIDILSIDSTGTLIRTAGAENASPVAPAVPTGNIAIAQIFNRVGQTSVKDVDDSTNGYIQKDLRKFISQTNLPKVEVFTSNGTYTKPTNAKFVTVICMGAGGGGAGGTGAGAGTGTRRGGGGGGSGSITTKTFRASDLASTVTVTVGTGGAGSAGTTGAASSLDSSDGGNSSFGSHLFAYGGGGGRGTASPRGGAGGGNASGAVLDTPGTPSALANTNAIAGQGAPGADNNAEDGYSSDFGGCGGGIGCVANAGTPDAGRGGSSIQAGGAGGGGGGVTSANVHVTSAQGGKHNGYTPGGGGALGATSGGVGGNGTSRSGYGCGDGGGGGGGNTAGTGGVGGNGGAPGGGAGGGGGGTSTGGAGGAGGNGEVRVFTW